MEGTPSAWHRGWRVMSLEGTTLWTRSTGRRMRPRLAGRRARAGRMPRANATGAFPQVRLVGLLGERGARAPAGGRGPHGAHRRDAVPRPSGLPELRSVAPATTTGAALVWRASATITLPVLARYTDGSYRSLALESAVHKRRPHAAIRASRRLHRGGRAGARASSPCSWSPRARRPPNWRHCITSAGKWRSRMTNSKPFSAKHCACCAARRRTWCSRKRGASCSRTSRSARSCARPLSARCRTAASPPTGD